MDKEQALKMLPELKQELGIRKKRHTYNQFAGVCKKSLFYQKKIIFELELEIWHLEFKLENDLFKK